MGGNAHILVQIQISKFSRDRKEKKKKNENEMWKLQKWTGKKLQFGKKNQNERVNGQRCRIKITARRYTSTYTCTLYTEY